jgi:ribosomal protein L37AE/L43A
MKKIGIWLIDKWLAGFITTAFFFILKLYLDLPAENKTTFFNFGWFSKILNTPFHLKYTILIIILLIVITRIERRIYKSQKSAESDIFEEPETDFLHFKSGYFGATLSKWTWDYKWRIYEQKYQIVDLQPSCKKCDIPMQLERIPYGTATCHKCRLNGKNDFYQIRESPSDIEKEILRMIQCGEIPKK